MFSIFKKKVVIPHVRMTGVIGSVGRFKQGLDLSNQQEILKKAFSYKKAKTVAISINSPGGSPVQSHLIHDFIRQQAKKNKPLYQIGLQNIFLKTENRPTYNNCILGATL